MNVQEVQRKLWEQSRTHKEHREAGRPLFPTNPYENRVRNLMDLMHQPDWLHAAMVRVIERSKGKAPGVDGVTTYKFTRRGLEQKFEQLRLELRNGIYQPKPLRRVEIPKSECDREIHPKVKWNSRVRQLKVAQKKEKSRIGSITGKQAKSGRFWPKKSPQLFTTSGFRNPRRFSATLSKKGLCSLCPQGEEFAREDPRFCLVAATMAACDVPLL
ncbi:MAG: hypothetical protein FWC43_11935, partial [Planctomycetaceae bacterium]|nr:hypothetical protein [Planctomycetaceae bacterium]